MTSHTKNSVKDFMRHDVLVTASPEETLMNAIEKMAKQNVGSVVITDKDGKVLGIITERDVIRLVAKSTDLNTKLENVMTRNPITIYYDEYIQKAYLLMRENNIRHLPVVNKENKFVGMLSLRDIAKFFTFEPTE